jgi:hypothetical protein
VPPALSRKEFLLTTYENLDGKSQPFSCRVCRRTPGAFFGRLLLPGDQIPQCPNHSKRISNGTMSPEAITLVPSGTGR